GARGDVANCGTAGRVERGEPAQKAAAQEQPTARLISCACRWSHPRSWDNTCCSCRPETTLYAVHVHEGTTDNHSHISVTHPGHAGPVKYPVVEAFSLRFVFAAHIEGGRFFPTFER